MQQVQSSMLSHIGYDAERMTLLVRFHPSKKQQAAGEHGDLWEYSPVVSEKWDEAQTVIADPEGSIGKWFLSTAKGKYDGKKMETDHPIATQEQVKWILDALPLCECGVRPSFTISSSSIKFHLCGKNPDWTWKLFDINDRFISIMDLSEGEGEWLLESLRVFCKADRIAPHPTDDELFGGEK